MIPPYNDHRSLPVSHYGACIYFTRIQLTLPAASISETLFTKFFQGAARRAGITDTSVFLLGFDTIALQAEKTILLLTLKYILLHWTNRVINIDHQLLRDTEVGYYISTPKTGMRGRERNGPSTSCMDWIGMEKKPSIGRGIQNGYHCMNRIFWYHTTAVLSRMRSRLPCMRSRLDGIPF